MKKKAKEVLDGRRPMSIRINDELRYRLKMRAATDRRTCTSIVEELLTAHLADSKPTPRATTEGGEA